MIWGMHESWLPIYNPVRLQYSQLSSVTEFLCQNEVSALRCLLCWYKALITQLIQCFVYAYIAYILVLNAGTFRIWYVKGKVSVAS